MALTNIAVIFERKLKNIFKHKGTENVNYKKKLYI